MEAWAYKNKVGFIYRCIDSVFFDSIAKDDFFF